MTELTWNGDGADWDAAQQEQTIRHEAPTGMDSAGTATLELGYPSILGSFSGTLISYYPMGEASGASTINDVHGPNSGEYRGPTTAGAAGVFGDNVPTFDGTDDLADTNNRFESAGVNTNSDHALGVGAWVRKDSWNTSYENIVSNWDGSDGGIRIQRDASNNQFRVSMDNHTVTGSVDVADGSWHLVYGQVDSNNVGELYVDGALDNSGSVGTADAEITTQDHYIGAQPDGTGTDPAGGNFWSGEIAHLFVLDCYDNGNASLLSASEVSQLYEVTSNASHVSSKQPS